MICLAGAAAKECRASKIIGQENVVTIVKQNIAGALMEQAPEYEIRPRPEELDQEAEHHIYHREEEDGE